jgi:hypothetical protein
LSVEFCDVDFVAIFLSSFLSPKFSFFSNCNVYILFVTLFTNVGWISLLNLGLEKGAVAFFVWYICHETSIRIHSTFHL